jgi:uncharacterized membrane protein
MRMKEKEMKKFAPGFCWQKMFLVFVIGCIFGALFEEIYHLFKLIYLQKPLFWEYHRGVIYGPFSPIYGFGALLMTQILAKKERPDWQTYLYSCLLGGGVEYLLSYLQELATGTVSWDYRGMFLNINGRTNIPYMLVFGLLGLIFVKYVYPFISKSIESLSPKFGQIMVNILVVFLSIDALVSWTALYREEKRNEGIPAKTKIDKLYDKYYTDEFLDQYFHNRKKK